MIKYLSIYVSMSKDKNNLNPDVKLSRNMKDFSLAYFF